MGGGRTGAPLKHPATPNTGTQRRVSLRPSQWVLKTCVPHHTHHVEPCLCVDWFSRLLNYVQRIVTACVWCGWECSECPHTHTHTHIPLQEDICVSFVNILIFPRQSSNAKDKGTDAKATESQTLTQSIWFDNGYTQFVYKTIMLETNKN